MEKSLFTIKWLLNPCSPTKFMSMFWERKPLYIQRADSRNYYDELFSITDADNIVTTINHRPLSIAKDGAIIPSIFHANGENKEKVLEFYNNGGTIILDRVESSSYHLLMLCNHVRDFFKISNKVFCNVYVTPPGKQAFDLHADNQDVFIFQIEGTKNWKIFQPEFELPINELQSKIPEGFEERNEPIHDLVLNRGDLLYVPKGYPHKVSTTNQHSIHITLTVINYTWYDFYFEILRSSSNNNVNLRKSLPLDFLSKRSKTSNGNAFLRCWNPLSISEAIQCLRSAELNNGKPGLKGNLRDLIHVDSIVNTSVVRRRSGIRLQLKNDKGMNVIVSNIGQFKLEGLTRQIQFVIQNEKFRVSDIPGHLTVDEKIELATSFVRLGLLSVVK